MRDQFQVEITGEHGQPPLTRFLAGEPFPLPTPQTLAEAFLREQCRVVTKDRHRVHAQQHLRSRLRRSPADRPVCNATLDMVVGRHSRRARSFLDSRQIQPS